MFGCAFVTSAARSSQTCFSASVAVHMYQRRVTSFPPPAAGAVPPAGAVAAPPARAVVAVGEVPPQAASSVPPTAAAALARNARRDTRSFPRSASIVDLPSVDDPQ